LDPTAESWISYKPIFLDNHAELYCVVDDTDYDWAMQWRWSATPNSTGLKFYASRSTRLEGRDGGQTRIYLHKEILLRAKGAPPGRRFVIGDHLSGQSLDNRRCNLRWATRSMNARNIHGVAMRQMALEFGRRQKFAA
jgi:hypothetical protein